MGDDEEENLCMMLPLSVAVLPQFLPPMSSY